MAFYQYLTEFWGRKVVNFRKVGDAEDFSTITPRISAGTYGDEDINAYCEQLLSDPNLPNMEALVIGRWGEDIESSLEPIIEKIVSHQHKLRNLQALFLGDIIQEEMEASWIFYHNSISVLFTALPNLKHFTIRGMVDFDVIKHDQLNTLIIQGAGMFHSSLQAVLTAQAPLTHLEVWLGAHEHGAKVNIADFEPLLAGKVFPQLKRLGLCNSDQSDDLAEALANSQLLKRLEIIDFSMGTLGKRGAQALINSGQLGHLREFILNHHFVPENILTQLSAATPHLVASETLYFKSKNPERYYHIAISE